MDPAGWARRGEDVENWFFTYEMATCPSYTDPGDPKYYWELEEEKPAMQVRDDEACNKLYEYLKK